MAASGTGPAAVGTAAVRDESDSGSGAVLVDGGGVEGGVESGPVDVRDAARPPRPWTWVAAVAALVLAAQFATMLVRNPNFEWDVVGHYLFSAEILRGLLTTLYMTVIAMLIGIVFGGVLAACRVSDNPVLRLFAGGYIWVFRGTPQLVQLVFWFNIALLVPTLGLGVPFGPTFLQADANAVITPFLAAIVGLGLHEAAYQAEIYRAGLLSVDEGQIDAARSVGMTPGAVFFKIQLPQAMRFIVPPTFSQIIGMTKGTALVSVIGGAELLFAAQEIYSSTFQTIPLLIVACVWYLVATTVLNFVQYFIEAHYAKGAVRVPRSGIQALAARLLARRTAAQTAQVAQTERTADRAPDDEHTHGKERDHG
ncbi:amino acid ABC transporter permease [Streptomyces paludis]|uniref:Amino acid ABC transporter permease n=1 Tax=Streptomyces paludis TaxID=2282738 RepID=A0A345HI76_9ACTN|nr:amino acid ABC transporter permease [Streptomyces paludis]AXG76400.1 amino acid ABC transporter permease [Streptomyces paludis]